ncbi:MAG: hypothetical protein ACAF41_13660 [Leptolyngbya sp. BL-A-14]
MILPAQSPATQTFLHCLVLIWVPIAIASMSEQASFKQFATDRAANDCSLN